MTGLKTGPETGRAGRRCATPIRRSSPKRPEPRAPLRCFVSTLSLACFETQTGHRRAAAGLRRAARAPVHSLAFGRRVNGNNVLSVSRFGSPADAPQSRVWSASRLRVGRAGAFIVIVID